MKSEEKIWVTNSYFLILISLQPNVLNLRYFKLWIQLDQIILTFKFAAQQSQFILSVKNERGRLNYSKYLLKLLVEFYQFRGIIISFHKTKKDNLIKLFLTISYFRKPHNLFLLQTSEPMNSFFDADHKNFWLKSQVSLLISLWGSIIA